MVASLTLLIVDADVLIDFCEADPTVLKLISQRIGQVHVLTSVIAEVDQITEEECARLGIVVLDPPADIAAAAASSRGGLSFNDRLSLLMARDNDFSCVTNDKALRRGCVAEGVPVLWGLEVLALLVEAKGLSRARAHQVAEAIRRSNPLYITETIMKAFVARIEGAAGTRHRKRRE